MNSIQKLKADLKLMAKEIRRLKGLRKNKEVAPSGLVPGLSSLQWTFRHKHIAYCMLRGTPYNKIETMNKDSVKPDMEYIEWMMKAAQPESREKLYVIVDPKLNKSQQAVQAGHAVAAFLRKYPNTLWDNGTLVYLEDPSGWNAILEREKSWITREYCYFTDPDIPHIKEGLVNMLLGDKKEGPRFTAAAFFGHGAEKTFEKYKLL